MQISENIPTAIIAAKTEARNVIDLAANLKTKTPKEMHNATKSTPIVIMLNIIV